MKQNSDTNKLKNSWKERLRRQRDAGEAEGSKSYSSGQEVQSVCV